ncbi:MAG: radical SAM family heme chaperone HemW [Rhizobiaceae bacterium]|nr:radical SAM family heme chaperone HemW [Rhizobiaceae bacterium]
MAADSKGQFGIYVHWPFCLAKCPYCDFNSHVARAQIDEARFRQAYAREIAHMAGLSNGRKVTSVFFGGGTPSLMSAALVGDILHRISQHWGIAEGAEITLEANPTSVEAKRFAGYRAAGVNRLSVGIQALNDADLKALGRMHDVDEALDAFKLAQQTFARVSFDLIYARPHQSVEQWRKELAQALKYADGHMSLYQLTIEPKTAFFDLYARGKLTIPDDDLAIALYDVTQELTEAAGLNNYEISNHAGSNAQSQHNLTYWRYHDYVGIGPGAHGRLTIDGTKVATACEMNPENWWQKVMVDGEGMITNEKLDAQEMADEFLVMGLRLAQGISLQLYHSFAPSPLNADTIEFLKQQGLVEILANGNLRATASGFLVLDAVVADLAAEVI